MTVERLANRKAWALLAAGLLLYAGLLPQASKQPGGITQPVWTDGTVEKLGQVVRMLTAQQADAPGAFTSGIPLQRDNAVSGSVPLPPADGTIAVSLRLSQLAPLKFVSNYVNEPSIRLI